MEKKIRQHSGRDVDIVRAAAEALQASTGLRLRTEPSPGDDIVGDVVSITSGRTKPWTFTVQITTLVDPPVIGLLLERARRLRGPLLLITRHVDSRTGERLRETGLFYLDTLGNAWIRRPGLFVHMQGRRLPAAAPTRPRTSIHSRAMIQVVFSLLSFPGLVKATVRQIAGTARVGLGTADRVLHWLELQGFLQGGRGTRRLTRSELLLEEWVTAFTSRLRPRLVLGRFRALRPDWCEQADITPHHASWSGEVAAARLHLLEHPQTVSIYADAIPGRLLIENRLARDPEGSIEILRRFWADPIQDGSSPHANLGFVPLLLIYADLLVLESGRTREVAHLLRKKEMVPCLPLA